MQVESPMMLHSHATNFMASEYQGDAMQYRSQPYQVTVEGAGGNLFLDEDSVPKTHQPSPISASAINYGFTGDIFVTPDKGNNNIVEKSTGLNARRTVTFNDNINVQLMSPENSVCIVNSSADTLNSSDSNSATGRLNRVQLQGDRNDISDSVESSVETIDIVANDKGIPCLGTLDHTESELARPEFSSMISLTKQRIRTENANVDVANAVRDKLNIPKTKTKVEERAYSHLNRDDQQFRQLQSTDVTEDAVLRTEQVLSSRVQRAPKSDKTYKRDPDIMEFFKDGYQKETGSYNVDVFTKQHNDLETSESVNAFDVYRSVRSWEGW